MSTNPVPASILARIDTLAYDLLRQLAEQTELLSTPSSSAASSQSTQSSTDDPTTRRPAKRRREAKPKPKALTLLSFPPIGSDGAGGSKKNSVCFPTKSISGVRRFGEPLFLL